MDNNHHNQPKAPPSQPTKEDIGNPTNFQYRAHIGLDQDGGFSQELYDPEPMDEPIRALLKAAGIQNPDEMKPDDIKFVYDFLEQYEKSNTLPSQQQQHQQAHAFNLPSSSNMTNMVPKPPRQDFNSINRHTAHIGCDQGDGFSQQLFDPEPMDESIRALLKAAGIQNPDEMNPDDIKFVYNFLEQYDKSNPPPPHLD